jgi:hypothetical protein
LGASLPHGGAEVKLDHGPIVGADHHTAPAAAFRFGSLGGPHTNKGYDILIAALARVEARWSRPRIVA